MNATRATKIGARDPHRNIPKDADGVPVFFLLPAGMRASYERKLTACEAAWRETKDPFAFAEALSLAFFHRQPVPPWLHEAAWAVAAGRRGKAHVRRAREAATHLMRYMIVRDARAAGMSWDKAYERAVVGTAVEPEAAKKSYAQVKNDLRAKRAGLYHTIKRRGTTLPPSKPT
jgi:hypothetical protein